MDDRFIKLALDAGLLNYVDHETPRHYFINGHADLEDVEKFAKLVILETRQETIANVSFKPKPPRYVFSNEIVEGLRKQAEDCENNERDPKTSISAWPKETTLEWAAADLIDERLEEIRRYEDLRDKFVELWMDMRELLGGDDDETLA